MPAQTEPLIQQNISPPYSALSFAAAHTAQQVAPPLTVLFRTADLSMLPLMSFSLT